MDIYQSPYTPADLVLMSQEKETLEWDRCCRIVEMIHNIQSPKPMKFNATHPYRSTQAAPRDNNLKMVSAREFCSEMKKGVKHGDNSGSSGNRGRPRRNQG